MVLNGSSGLVLAHVLPSSCRTLCSLGRRKEFIPLAGSQGAEELGQIGSGSSRHEFPSPALSIQAHTQLSETLSQWAKTLCQSLTLWAHQKQRHGWPGTPKRCARHVRGRPRGCRCVWPHFSWRRWLPGLHWSSQDATSSRSSGPGLHPVVLSQ